MMKGAVDQDWAHVMPNQDFDGEEFFGTFHRGVQMVDVDAALFSGLAGVSVSTGLGVVGGAAGVAGATGAGVTGVTTAGVDGGARAPSMGLAVMKGAENMVRGDCPSSVVPSKGFEAGRMYASANASRFCKVSSDGRRPRTRVCSWSSCHVDWMTQGSDVELGGSNVRPRSLHGYAG